MSCYSILTIFRYCEYLTKYEENIIYLNLYYLYVALQ
jgi:hypothetical protein